MLTTDLSLRLDPVYEKISRRYMAHPEEFARAFARAWFKLTHRDMGPRVRYLGPEVPAEEFPWQDPIPRLDHPMIGPADVTALKTQILGSGIPARELVYTAWSSAATFRGSDKRGGANGARLRLAPQKDWAVNEPAQLARVLAGLERIRSDFNVQAKGGRRVSLADLIVLGGTAAVEKAARDGGVPIELAFAAGRMDAREDQTDIASFSALEPFADGFRNYVRAGSNVTAERWLIDRANLLTLTVPEMTVLIGGMRVLDANHQRSPDGVLTRRPGALTNDFFVNLLDMGTEWAPVSGSHERFEGHDRQNGSARWTGSRVDLIFGAHSELRAVAEVYASSDAKERFVRDFARAWTKVMNLDRFDLPR